MPYRIKLTSPWHSAASSLYYRQGLLVKVVINESLSGIGECAPMIEIGTESLRQAEQFLKHKLPSLTGRSVEPDLLSEMDALPASRFALETALIAVIEQHTEQHLAQILNPQYSHKIAVNVVLGSLDDDLLERAKQAEAQGFSCVKIKLGLNDIKDEAESLANLLQTMSPSIRVRLDANKSWTFAQTKWFLNYLEQNCCREKVQIDGIEEPLRKFNASYYHYLQNKTRISLALDESFACISDLKHFPVRRLVLKPMAQGGILNTWKLARQARKYKIETVITSSIETGYGLWPITYLCAAINDNQFHGLSTASWLENTLIEPPEIKHGTITL